MPKNILIVDDSSVMRKIIGQAVRSGGYEVAGEAKNHTEAVELYKKLKPNLVTMDLDLQGESGIDTIRAICSIDPKALVIVVTAWGHEDFWIESLAAGAKSRISKPFKTEDLLKAIEKVFL